MEEGRPSLSFHLQLSFHRGVSEWKSSRLVLDLDYKPMISYFDLEIEMFRVFSAPPPHQGGGLLIDVFALGGSLCVCDNSSEDEIVIWLMKEYGDEKSWRKEYVISKSEDYRGECYEVVRPLKVFKDGDMLMAWVSSPSFTIQVRLELFRGSKRLAMLIQSFIPRAFSLSRVLEWRMLATSDFYICCF